MTNYLQIQDNAIQINPEWLEKYKNFKALQLKMDLAEKEFKEQLKEAMEQTGKTSVIVDGFSAVVKKPTTRTSLDSKRLKAELPDIFEEYSKTSEVKGSITITVE